MPRVQHLPKDTELKLTDNVLVDDGGGTKTATVSQFSDLISSDTSEAIDSHFYFIDDSSHITSPLRLSDLELYEFSPSGTIDEDDNIYATSSTVLSVGGNVSALLFVKDAVAAEGYVIITSPDGDKHFSQIDSIDIPNKTITLESSFSNFSDFGSDNLGSTATFYTGTVTLNGIELGGSDDVEDWAKDGNEDAIPLSKLSNLAVEDWAKDGNTDKIPAAKIPDISFGDQEKYTTTALRNAATDITWHKGDRAFVGNSTDGYELYIYDGADQSTPAVTVDGDWLLVSFTLPTDLESWQSKIDDSGNISADVRPAADDTHDLGNASNRFSKIYANEIFVNEIDSNSFFTNFRVNNVQLLGMGATGASDSAARVYAGKPFRPGTFTTASLPALGASHSGYMTYDSTKKKFVKYVDSEWTDLIDFTSFSENIIPDGDDTRNLGSSSNRWSDAHIDAGYIESIYLDNKIYHAGDLNTFIGFVADVFSVNTGGVERVEVSNDNTYFSTPVRIGTDAATHELTGAITANLVDIPTLPSGIDSDTNKSYNLRLTDVGGTETYTWSEAAAGSDFNPASIDEDMIPDADGSRDLGSSTIAWSQVWADSYKSGGDDNTQLRFPAADTMYIEAGGANGSVIRLQGAGDAIHFRTNGTSRFGFTTTEAYCNLPIDMNLTDPSINFNSQETLAVGNELGKLQFGENDNDWGYILAKADTITSGSEESEIDVAVITGGTETVVGTFGALGLDKVANSRTGATSGLEVWHGTQAQYDAIVTKDANTIYFTT